VTADPRLTAIVCTLDRADCLRDALRSLLEQTADPVAYEVLVVDNGSRDATRSVVETEFAGRVRYLLEPETGLSRARNAGLRSARGSIVAYLDDDALAATGWVSAILRTFEEVRPSPGCVGGSIDLLWEAPRPPWLHEGLLGRLGRLALPGGPRPLGGEQYVFGGNSAYPAGLLAEIGGFPAELGRKGKSLLGHEEILVERTIQDRGLTVYYQPAMAIRHRVFPSRLRKEWFRRGAYGYGISEATLEIVREGLPALRRWGRAAGRAGKLLASPRALGCLALPSDDPARFLTQCSAWSQLGYIQKMLGAC
jgi:glucosyl-dolichyl phosphate glucuronosyltransferase